jgi:hypothetical protein
VESVMISGTLGEKIVLVLVFIERGGHLWRFRCVSFFRRGSGDSDNIPSPPVVSALDKRCVRVQV